MNLTRTLLTLAGTASLTAFLACGGGGGSSSTPSTPTATSLSYTDPASGTWQLKKDASSTSTHLVLNLVANGAGNGEGVALILTADASRVAWAKVQPGDPQFVRNGTVLSLGTAPQALKSKVSGGTLQIAVSQKGLASPAVLNGTVAQIALDLNAGAPQGSVSLAPVAGKAKSLDAAGAINGIALSVGTLAAN
jgi:hypothetical protein